MKTRHLSMIIIAFALLTAGCSQNPYHKMDSETLSGSVGQEAEEIQANKAISDDEKARRLSRMGERLVETPRGIDLALEIFEDALALDDSNTKANFYAGVLKPIRTLKGFPYRMTKLLTAEVMGDLTDNILDSISDRDLQKLASAYLTSGDLKSVFVKISDLQNFLATTFLPALEEAEGRLAKVEQEDNFRLTFNYRYWHRAWSLRNYFSLDQAEVRSIRVGMKGVATYVKLLTAYNIDAAITLKNQFADRPHVSLKEVLEAVKSHDKALTLRAGADARLRSILDDLSEAIEGLRVIARVLNTDDDRENFILKNINHLDNYADLMSGLNYAADILTGPISVRMGYDDENSRIVSIVLDGTALIANPVQDLKSLLPTEFDETGKKITSFPDNSFGGFSPNSDLIEKYCRTHREEDEDKIRRSIQCP